MTATISLTLRVNGQNHDLTIEPRQTLADALRDQCRLTGTHLGCEHGVCGACTIIADGRAVRSCLMFAVQAQGMDLRTVEGLAGSKGLHVLQSAFIEHHALQCGYCTSGFLMLSAAALEQDAEISEERLVEVLSSNLCRCTGYKAILDAVKAAQARILQDRVGLATQEDD